MQYKNWTIPLVLFLCAGICTPLLAQEKPWLSFPFETRVKRSIEHFARSRGIPSISFSFFGEQEEAFDFTTGYADMDRRIAATPEHLYTLASVTKPVTAMTMLNLVHQNRVSLDDSASKFIENFPEGITIADLLNHTSGLRRENENEHHLTNSSYRDVVNYLPRKFKNKKHRYANINYAAIGAIIEKITGRSFREVAADYFVSITGDSLYFYNYQQEKSDHLFVKYYVKKGRRRYPHRPVSFGMWEPAALAQSTASALAKFVKYHLNPEFTSYLEKHAVYSRGYAGKSGMEAYEKYALGFRLRYKNKKLISIYHNGFIYGVISTVCYFPEKRAGFAILANMSTYPRRKLSLFGLSHTIARQLAEAYTTRMAHCAAVNSVEYALRVYSDSLDIMQPRGYVLKKIGNDLLKNGEKEKAFSVLHLANALFPEEWGTYERLAEAYLLKGDLNLARSIVANGAEADSLSARRSKIFQTMEGFGSRAGASQLR